MPHPHTHHRHLLPALALLLLWSGTLIAEEAYWIYTVRPGDNIWNLTAQHCTSVLHWKRIQRLNNIPDGPDRTIPPGTRLRFPLDILKRQPVPAIVVKLQGTVKLQRADGSEDTVAESSRLYSGDRLSTGENSSLTVRFADGSELLVTAGSEVHMDSLSAYGDNGMVDTRIRLQGGQVDSRVRPAKAGPDSRYRIITPAAVAAVRGTEYRVAAERDQPVARSEVLEGTVGVSGGGRTQAVPAGYGVVARAGAAPGPPKPLLPPPDLSQLQTPLDRLPLQFEWPALEGATGYRFQVADTAAFDRLLADGTTPARRAFWADLPDGEYYLRVRGVDTDGLEGLNAQRRFVVDARPEPPVPVGLVDQAVVRTAQPEFGWSSPEGISRYRLQIARDDSFSTLRYDQDDYSGQRFTPPQPLQEGHWSWRIASIDPGGEQGPYSDPQRFEYKAIPASPEVEAPAISKDQLVFQWRSAGEDLHYQFQFASDPDFDNVLLDRTVTEPRIEIDRPLPDNYYFRVRAIDATGYAGPYSTTQRIEVPSSVWSLVIPAGIFMLLLI